MKTQKPQAAKQMPGLAEPHDGYYPGEELERVKTINKGLLAVAKGVLEMLEMCGYGGNNPVSEKVHVKYLRDAIAKAEGREVA